MASQDKSYRCASCNAEFNSQDELDRHMKSAHKSGSTESRTPGSSERDREQRDRSTEREIPR